MYKKKEKIEKIAGGSIKDTIKDIRGKFGSDAIMMLGEKPAVDIDALSTGSIGIDHALGIGGLPRGRIIEVFGPESSGKTTLALHVIAEAQKKGQDCAFIDAEHSMDPRYAKNLGVLIDKLLISQPNNGEEALQIVDSLVRSNKIGVIVVDSVAALTPRSVIEGEIGQNHVGALARLMSQSLNMLKGVVSKSNTIVIFINQLRMNIAAATSWGAPPEQTAGGKALKFYSDVRIEIKRIATIKKGEIPVGGRARVKIVKNKVASPFGVAEFDVLFDQGISREGELLSLGDIHGVLEKSTAGYAWGDTKLGRGYDTSIVFLKENPDVANSIYQEILVKLKAE
jgi:recombination protein RecA